MRERIQGAEKQNFFMIFHLSLSIRKYIHLKIHSKVGFSFTKRTFPDIARMGIYSKPRCQQDAEKSINFWRQIRKRMILDKKIFYIFQFRYAIFQYFEFSALDIKFQKIYFL